MFMLMFLVMLCGMWFLVLWQWLWLRRKWLEGGVWIGGWPWWPKVAYWVRVKIASGRTFGLTPWIGLDIVYGWALEHGTLEHGTFVLWALKLWTFHWRALERWHHFHGVLINWMSLHTAITRVPRTTAPLQLCHSFMCHLVEWFVQQTIPEGNNQPLFRHIHLTGVFLYLEVMWMFFYVKADQDLNINMTKEVLFTYRRVGHFWPQEHLLYSAFTYGAAPSCMVKDTVFSVT